MSWLFKSDWVTNPRNPTNTDLDNLAKDQGRSGLGAWGGDVDAGAYALVNLGSLTVAAAVATSLTATSIVAPLYVLGSGDADLLIGKLLNPGATTAGRLTYMPIGKSLASGGSGYLGYYSDTGTPANGYLALLNYGDTLASQGLVLKQGGKVGIATTTPGALLSVAGAVHFGGQANVWAGGPITGMTVANAKTVGSQAIGWCVFSSEALASNPFIAYLALFGGAATADRYAKIQTGEYGAGGYPSLALQPDGGKVGIGVALPAAPLHVKSGGNLEVTFEAGGGSRVHLTSGGSCQFDIGLNYFQANSFSIHDVTNNYDPITIAALALVGINCVAPKANLHVVGTFIHGVPTSQSVTDGNIGNSQVFAWYDEGNNRLAFRVKSSAGVLKTGYVTVA